MFEAKNSLKESALSLIDGEPNLVANLANLSSLLFHSTPNLNWLGFYLWDEKSQELVVGPFQGKPACVRIKPHRGVCGLTYSSQKAQLVNDVSLFNDHIACDADSKSELVVPIVKNGKCLGVLDLDSPTKDRFTAEDLKVMQEIADFIAIRLF